MKINKEITDKIIAHAKKEDPIEACGYLAGKDDIIIKHYDSSIISFYFMLEWGLFRRGSCIRLGSKSIAQSRKDAFTLSALRCLIASKCIHTT